MSARAKSILWLCLLANAAAGFAFPEQPSQHRGVLDSSLQLIVVTTTDWSSADGHLQMYQRSSAEVPWQAEGGPIAIVVGKGGMAWGIGLDPLKAMRGPTDPVKREGDYKSPAGIFRLGDAFGYAPREPVGWKVRYLPITPSTRCVDDPQSRFYNQILDSSAVDVDWKSAEQMRDVGECLPLGARDRSKSSSGSPARRIVRLCPYLGRRRQRDRRLHRHAGAAHQSHSGLAPPAGESSAGANAPAAVSADGEVSASARCRLQ